MVSILGKASLGNTLEQDFYDLRAIEIVLRSPLTSEASSVCVFFFCVERDREKERGEE